MFCTLVLLTIIFMLIVIAFIGFSIFGTAFLIVFGDILFCILFVAWIVKKIISRRRG